MLHVRVRSRINLGRVDVPIWIWCKGFAVQRGRRQNGEHWFVVQTHRSKEGFAVQQLKNQGYQTFSPTFVKTVRRNRRFIQAKQTLFPGYVFVRFDPTDRNWRSINGTYGVNKLIMSGNEPAALPFGFVDGMVR